MMIFIMTVAIIEYGDNPLNVYDKEQHSNPLPLREVWYCLVIVKSLIEQLYFLLQMPDETGWETIKDFN